MDSQGRINGKCVQLMNKPEELKQFMSDKTEEQKRQARSHLALVKKLKKLKKKGEKNGR